MIIINIDELVKYAQIISPILAMLAILVSWIIFIIQKERERKERAIQIGKETEPIMHRIAYINAVFESECPELLEILYNADKSKMKKFEYKEIENVYTNEALSVMKNIFYDNSELQNKMGGAGVRVKVSASNLLRNRNIYHKLFDGKLDDLTKRKRNDVLDHEFHQMIIDTLNRLETLCLMMNQDIADEQTVYGALGDKFLAFIALFYYYISSTNNNVTKDSKKMKNVIRIFNKWNIRAKRNECIQRYQKKMKEFFVNLLSKKPIKNKLNDMEENNLYENEEFDRDMEGFCNDNYNGAKCVLDFLQDEIHMQFEIKQNIETRMGILIALWGVILISMMEQNSAILLNVFCPGQVSYVAYIIGYLTIIDIFISVITMTVGIGKYKYYCLPFDDIRFLMTDDKKEEVAELIKTDLKIWKRNREINTQKSKCYNGFLISVVVLVVLYFISYMNV